jgi:hypothetical protein
MNRPLINGFDLIINTNDDDIEDLYIIKLKPLMNDQTVHNKKSQKLQKKLSKVYEVQWEAAELLGFHKSPSATTVNLLFTIYYLISK